MPSNVELADKASRKRAILIAVAAWFFLIIQVVTRPVFINLPESAAHLSRLVMWGVNAAALLLLLLTGGGLAQRKAVRILINDEISRNNSKSAVVIGYWIAMTVAMALYFVAGDSMNAREAIYLIVTPSVGLALLSFSFMELRAHRDG